MKHFGWQSFSRRMYHKLPVALNLLLMSFSHALSRFLIPRLPRTEFNPRPPRTEFNPRPPCASARNSAGSRTCPQMQVLATCAVELRRAGLYTVIPT